MKIIIVLPCYNEALNLPPLLKRIDQFSGQVPFWDIEVIVVNDGSEDQTLEVANHYQSNVPKTILDIQPNSGLANAIRQGITNGISKLRNDDLLVILDGDDTHNPFLIETMVRQIQQGSDVVIASRFQLGARVIGLSQRRKLYSWIASILFRFFIGIKGVKDYTCGFRVYRAAVLQKALDQYGQNFIEEKGFACMVEILLKLNKLGVIMHEVPMILRYNRKQGTSKMNVRKTVISTLRLLVNNR